MSEEHLIFIDRVTWPIQRRQPGLKHTTSASGEFRLDVHDALDTRDTTNRCQRTALTLGIEHDTHADMPRSRPDHHSDDTRSNIGHGDDSK